MVGLYNHCTFNLNPRATSIDTTLHGFVPHAHVDHVHADAVIAIAASENAEALTKEIYGGELGFLPWQRPGFDLGLKLGAMAEANPNMKGVVLGGHGLFTWGPTSKECYRITLEMINKAARMARGEARQRQPSEGRVWRPCRGRIGAMSRRSSCPPFASTFPQASARSGTSPTRRRCWSSSIRAISSPLAALGTSCPDHFLRTKIRPLVLPYDPTARNLDAVIASLDKTLADYRADYAAYYERCKHPNSPAMRDPNAVIYLVPGVGMLSFAKDKATARIAAEFYVNAINVMRGVAERRPLCRAFGAGSVQYRILAAGRGQASAHAEAEIARRTRRAGDRRRGRHRAGDRGSAHERGRLRRARRHRRPEPRRGGRRLRQDVRQGRRQRRSCRRDERG